MKIGIVGHGFVGKAVDYGFEHPLVRKFYVDPLYGTNIDDLIKWGPEVTFICVPTPMSEDGSVDASIVEDAVTKLSKGLWQTLIIIKSTIPPNIVSSFNRHGHNDIVYNPEFLTEKSAQEQFINPPFHIFGGDPEVTKRVRYLYDTFSLCNKCDVYMMTAAEASFVKYSINAFLAMKVTFFNQLFDAVKDFGGNNSVITRAIGADPRIGTGHTKVPGFDMKRGFGGACFPKDTKAFTKFSDKLTLIEKMIEINNEYRSQYEKDEREEAQNIKYD